MTSELSIWDRFMGTLCDYIQNYQFAKYGELWRPDIDYEIKSYDKLERDWYYLMMQCDNINEFPPGLKSVAIEYMPTYFERYPDHKGAECLRLD